MIIVKKIFLPNLKMLQNKQVCQFRKERKVKQLINEWPKNN